MLLPETANDETRALARQLGVTSTLADVLTQKGIVDVAAAKKFLQPKLAHLTPPDAMADRDSAADRLVFALRAGEPIVVFGDYDCDGITAAAIMTEALRKLGGRVTPLLASRFDGGYGLSDDALQRVLSASPKLLVTCDCGSSDHPRVHAAARAGIDVIVIDHHLVPAEALDAVAFLNPHRPECGFPYKGLASCGLALSIAAAVRTKLGVELDMRPFLDLVAVGTIADVAPLDGDNRALVRSGMELLRNGARPGLKALAEYAKLNLSGGLTAEDISFGIAPRINAPGRMGAPEMALELLLARDTMQARSAAAQCEQANQRRKEIQDRMITEALADIAQRGLADQNAIVVGRENWHHGVVGIVAGRVASQFHKSVIVASIEQGIAKGSVRSARGVPVVTALNRCRSLLLRLGGHEKAAGVEFEASKLMALQEAFSAECASLMNDPAAVMPVEQRVHVRLDESDSAEGVFRDFASLEPCGEANRAPMLHVVDARVIAVRDLKGHLRLELEVNGSPLAAFGPNLGKLASTIKGRVHVAGALRRDTYRGGGALEMRVDAVEGA
ncbi:MAG: single-stranded-DNA-specific exonuclease RecJ [Polyangiaceae bacterium]